MKKLRYILWSLVVIAAAVLGLTTLTAARHRTALPERMETVRMNNTDNANESAVSGVFALTDQQGKIVTNTDFPGKWQLVFFGFTHCPEVCPATLAQITRLMNGLGPLAEDIQPLFISLDPQRDTPERLSEYLQNFHPKIIGLTGSDEELKKVAENFKIYYSRMENPNDPEHYMINHSTVMYLFSPQGKAESFYGYEESYPDVIADMQDRIGRAVSQ